MIIYIKGCGCDLKPRIELINKIVWNKMLENCSISLLLKIIVRITSNFSINFKLKHIKQIFDDEKHIFLNILIIFNKIPIFV